MAGELGDFDVIPPERADQVVAWCTSRYPGSVRAAALGALREMYGIPADRGAPAVDAAITRSQGWTPQQAQELAWAAEGWEAPTPLSAVPALPAFPVGIYPPWLADEVTAVAEFTQTPTDLGGTIVLSVLATAAGGRARVQVREGWTEPVNLYGTVAMPPGSRKSTVHATLVSPVLDAEEALAAAAAASIREAKVLRSMADKAAKAAENDAASATGDERDKKRAEAIGLALTAELTIIPVMPRLLADDVGPEKAAIIMAEQGGRLAILSAEGGPFVSLAGRYTKEPNLDFFLKSWSGDPIRVDRVVRDSEHIPCPALTLGLAVQPEVLKQIFTRPGFEGRGLLARVLYSMPHNTVGHRRSRTAPVPPEVSSRYRQTMSELVQDFAGWTDPAVFTLTDAASELVYQAQERIEPRLDPHGGDLGHIAEWASKLIGTTARIAGLLHAAEYLGDAHRCPIGEETMAKALAAGEYFTDHARAVFDFMGADQATEDAKVVQGWIRRMGRTRFTRRDVHRALARFRKAEDADPALELLAASGWIRAEKTAAPGPQGGRSPSPAFAVHPALLKDR